MVRHIQILGGRLDAERIVDDAKARTRAIGAHLAAGGQHDQRRAGRGGLALQRGDGRAQGIQLLLGLRLFAVDGGQGFGVARHAAHQIARVDGQVNGGRQLGQLIVFGRRPAGHEDHLRLRGVDHLVVGFKQRTDFQVALVGVLRQLRRQLGHRGHTRHFHAQRVHRIQHRHIHDDGLLRIGRHVGLAARMLDGHGGLRRAHANRRAQRQRGARL
ncbi:hypothetical protein D3C71_1359050 [compost metagenome]